VKIKRENEKPIVLYHCWICLVNGNEAHNKERALIIYRLDFAFAQADKETPV
jgi:hypothetical protein